MARPLNNIRDWKNVHGIENNMMNRTFKKAYMNSGMFTYEMNDRLFSEEDYVALMQFRKNYIMKLHALLKERLPRYPTINIRIPKKYINYYVNTRNKSHRLLNEKIAGITNATSRKKATIETVGFTDIEIIINYIGVSSYKFVFNIVNPENKEMWQQPRTSTEINGVNIQNTVFEAVKELSNNAVSAVQESAREYLYKPGTGILYKGARNNFSETVGSQRKRKTRKARKNRV
jgi:hypothetical protein